MGFEELIEKISEGIVEAEKEDKKVLFLKRIYDIYSALNYGAVESALALALTLPSVCGMVYMNAKDDTRDNYIKWINDYVINEGEEEYGCLVEKSGYRHRTIFPDGKCDGSSYGETIYELRCKYFHQHYDPTNVEKCLIRLPKLVSGIEKRNEDGSVDYKIECGYNSSIFDVPEFIYTLCGYAFSFYEKNEEKFREHDGKWLSIYDV